jgi:undecaprenyl-phosphate 4-deoxy-4-formamido-L-arabinose transferase
LIGIVLLGLGVVGEYIGRIYQEVRKRPRFVIQKVLEQNDIITVYSECNEKAQENI